MATDPEQRTWVIPVIQDGYGGRYEEDSFDYPSSAEPVGPGPTEEPPPAADDALASDAAPEPPSEADERPGPSGSNSLGQLVAARRGLVLAVLAGLLAVSGVGVSLSMVSDAVSDPGPGSAVQVPAPTPPAEQAPAPSAPPSSPADASSVPGGTASSAPSRTGQTPGAGTGARDEGEGRDDGLEGQEREDGGRSGDG
ncbi:hypothetical protein [Streptomyces soliscabiei]|uniref:hypothetical protein n=1 Tax=Streptomyces soliscabiei TaxID=588897 RepID=UPI0029B43085|nr:hypothetical protein [Streptomyces sp. NY05-11A]MDX2675373.1 hypothetical protein [Streptomyces sp. NY05-11A]